MMSFMVIQMHLKERLIAQRKGEDKRGFSAWWFNKWIYDWRGIKNHTGTVWRWISITLPKAALMLHLHTVKPAGFREEHHRFRQYISMGLWPLSQ